MRLGIIHSKNHSSHYPPSRYAHAAHTIQRTVCIYSSADDGNNWCSAYIPAGANSSCSYSVRLPCRSKSPFTRPRSTLFHIYVKPRPTKLSVRPVSQSVTLFAAPAAGTTEGGGGGGSMGDAGYGQANISLRSSSSSSSSCGEPRTTSELAAMGTRGWRRVTSAPASLPACHPA